MSYYAQYDLLTGFINGVVRTPATVLPLGIGQVEIPFDTDGGSHRINLSTLTLEAIPEE